MSFFLSKLQAAYANAYKHGLKKKYTEPKIYHGGKDFDLSQRWYVYFSYEHPILKNKNGTPKMVRQTPITMEVNRKYKTKEGRLGYLGIIKELVYEFLKNNHSPYEGDFNFNTESLEYTAESALDFAYNLKVTTLAETSISDYKSRYNQFKVHLGKESLLNRNILSITKKTVNDYFNDIQRNSSPRNRNNTRTVLSALFGVLEANDIIPKNFIEKIDVISTTSTIHRTYSLSALEGLFKFLKEKDPLLLLFIKVVSYNFLRPIEVCRLRLEDISISQKLLFVRTKNKKRGKKTKIIPDIVIKEIGDFDYSHLDFYLFTPNGVGTWDAKETSRREYWTTRFRKIKKKYNEYLIKQGETYQLGKEYTIYSFRHTFITLLFRKFREELSYSETCDKLMLITGHSTLKALKEYLKDIDAELPEDYSGELLSALEYEGREFF